MDAKTQIIIFGGGLWGKMAYYYYATRTEILCFIDNNKDIWGTMIEGIHINSPDVLKTYDLDKVSVVIAVKNSWREIQKQLFNDYNVMESTLFRIEEHSCNLSYPEQRFDVNEQEVIICYTSGLGNQMFQYALSRCFVKDGKKVTGDISGYNFFNKRKFELPEVFPNINFKKCSSIAKFYYENVIDCQYQEVSIEGSNYIEANMKLLEVQEGVMRGFWQSYKYVEKVEEELKYDFQFKNKQDVGLQNVIEGIKGQNAVAVHIRRGDYLQSDDIYGGVCTDKYYREAMQYIFGKEKNIVFYFFSNDIKWVRKKYRDIKNAVFVMDNMFDDYEDWYDMYLMSLCKHNIIANSTFSWWGAWLNKNINKIVIAPHRWLNITQMPDICPVSWIRI